MRSRHQREQFNVPTRVGVDHCQILSDVSNVMITPVGGDVSEQIPSVAKLSALKQRIESLHTQHEPAHVIYRNSHVIRGCASDASLNLPPLNSSDKQLCVSTSISNFRPVPRIVANAFKLQNKVGVVSMDSERVVQPHPLQLLFRYTDFRDIYPNCTWKSFLTSLEVNQNETVSVPGARPPIMNSFVSLPHMSKKPALHVNGFWSWHEWRHLRNIKMLTWRRYYTQMPMISHMNRYIAQERSKSLNKKRSDYDDTQNGRTSIYKKLVRAQLDSRIKFYFDHYATSEKVIPVEGNIVNIPPIMQSLIDIEINSDVILGCHNPKSDDILRCPYPQHKSLKFNNSDLLDHHLLVCHRLNPADDTIATADALGIELSLATDYDDAVDGEFEYDFEE